MSIGLVDSALFLLYNVTANSATIMNKVLLVFDYFWQLVGLFDPIGCFN